MKQRDPDPLSSDGSGNSLICHLQFPRRLDLHSDGGSFSVSHPTQAAPRRVGEGRGVLETPSCRYVPNVYPRLAQMTPVEKAFVEIDAKVTASGWGVSDNKELNPSAVRGIDFEPVALQADNLSTDPFGLL